MWDFRASSPTKVWSHSISIEKKNLFYYVFLLATKKYRDITYNHPIKGWLLWDTTSLSKCTLFSLKCTAISGRTTKAPTADETQETGKSANPAVHAYPVANNGPQATTTDRRNTHALRWSSPAVPTDGTIDQLASQPRANRVARVGACVRTWWDPIAGLGGRATTSRRRRWCRELIAMVATCYDVPMQPSHARLLERPLQCRRVVAPVRPSDPVRRFQKQAVVGL
jgi:hypothetical protein